MTFGGRLDVLHRVAASLALLAGFIVPPAQAAGTPQGTLSRTIHVSLAPTFFDPAEAHQDRSAAHRVNNASCLGRGKRSANIIPHALEFYRHPPAYPYDPARAKKLLAEAGYPSGFDAGELSAEAFAASGIGEPVANDFAAVGIRVRQRPLERAAFLKSHAEKKLKNVILTGSRAPGNGATRIEQYVVSTSQYREGQ